MEYRVIQFKEFKTPFLITGAGIALIGIYISAWVTLLIFLINKQPDYDSKYLFYIQNYSELKLDSIKVGRPHFLPDPIHNSGVFDEISFWIKLINNSDDICFVLATFTIDNLTMEPHLRKKIRDEDTLNFEGFKDTTFREFVMSSKESKWFKCSVPLFPATKNKTNIHCMVVYSNSKGGYYDLYIIQEMQYLFENEIEIKTQTDTVFVSKDSAVIYLKNFIPPVFKFTENKIIYPPHTFNIQEMEFIDSFFKTNLQSKKQ